MAGKIALYIILQTALPQANVSDLDTNQKRRQKSPLILEALEAVSNVLVKNLPHCAA